MVTGRREEGFALLLAVVVLILVGFALALLATSLTLQMADVRNEAQRLQLTALADAALAETLARLEVSAAFTGLPEQELHGGIVWSRVERQSSALRRIEAGARVVGRERRVEALARVTARGVLVLNWRPMPLATEQEPGR